MSSLKKTKIIRPVTRLIACNSHKKAYALMLKEGTVIVAEDKEKNTTVFAFSAGGYSYNIIKDQVFDRPARVAGNLLREHLEKI